MFRCRGEDGGSPPLEGAKSFAVDAAERESLLTGPDYKVEGYQNSGRDDRLIHPAGDNSLTRTRFEFMNWSLCEVLHGEEIRCVAIDAEGDFVDLATLDGRAT